MSRFTLYNTLTTNIHITYNRYKVKTTGCHTHFNLFQKELLYLSRVLTYRATSESMLYAQVEQSVTRSFQLFLKIKIHKKKKFFKKCFECCLSSNSHYTFLHICPFVTRFVIFLEICRRKLCLNPNSKNSKFKFLYL